MMIDGLVGQTIGGYRLDAVLGRGGMGVVYLAEAPDGTRAAVKLLAQTDDEEIERRFLNEVRLAQALQHPHVIPIYASGKQDGRSYLAMRYIDGGDLKQLLVREGTLSPNATVRLVRELADSLDAAHERGLVHRDVKPANILIDQSSGENHVYLADFGVAKRRDDSHVGLTASGQLLGTVDYMAPEQIRGEPIDGRTDIYSLGCVSYQCLTGATPYSGSDVAVLWAQVNDDPPTLAGESADLARFDAVLERALAKDPADRYPTAGAFASDLERALAATSVPVAPAERLHRTRWRSPLRWLVVAMITALLGQGVTGLASTTTTSTSHGPAVKPYAAPSLRLPVLRPGNKATALQPKPSDPPGQFDLRTERGHSLVINFFASWCPPCVADLPLLSGAAYEYRDTLFLAVDTSERRAAALRFLGKHPVGYTTVYDAKRSVARAWGTKNIPTTFFVNASGRVVYRVAGALTTPALSAGLEAIHARVPPG